MTVMVMKIKRECLRKPERNFLSCRSSSLRLLYIFTVQPRPDAVREDGQQAGDQEQHQGYDRRDSDAVLFKGLHVDVELAHISFLARASEGDDVDVVEHPAEHRDEAQEDVVLDD